MMISHKVNSLNCSVQLCQVECLNCRHSLVLSVLTTNHIVVYDNMSLYFVKPGSTVLSFMLEILIAWQLLFVKTGMHFAMVVLSLIPKIAKDKHVLFDIG